ncbi:MAG: histidinol-phosphate transaminase [Pseudonocardiales bacterium]|nr:MAG: histidinol-phosphate transaminase [Pseudonocardiales bacterium]
MSVHLRPVLGGLKAYKPGRSPADIARELGLDAAVKLASNESAYGPLPSVLDVIAAAAAGINRYPDMAATELTTALAKHCAVSTDQVAIGCGSVGLYQQLLAAVVGPGDEVLYAWRSFEVYPILVGLSGATAVPVPLRDATHDLETMAAAVHDRTRMIFVCNPNNPTGTAVHAADLERFLDAVPDDVLVIIDEAYREFVTDPDVPDGLELAAGRDNVAVLRTMSKAYGLAGLRVGYCVSAPPVIEALRKVQLPFTVSTVAQAAAVASLAAGDELLERVRATVAERSRVADALRGLGVDVPATEANFVWLSLGSDAVPFATSCEQRGLIVRPFDGDGVRVTVGAPEENDRFLSVAADLLGPPPG